MRLSCFKPICVDCLQFWQAMRALIMGQNVQQRLSAVTLNQFRQFKHRIEHKNFIQKPCIADMKAAAPFPCESRTSA